MDTVTRLIQHPLYKEKYDALQVYEKKNACIVACHDMRHLCAWHKLRIRLRENGLSFSAEEITIGSVVT